MPCLYCRKMCCLNGSRKLHFVQKIRLDLNKFGAGWIFRTKCVFLQVLNLHIFLQKQPGHWGRGCLHFHLSFISFICSPKGNGNFGRIAERSRFSCHKLENYRIRRDEQNEMSLIFADFWTNVCLFHFLILFLHSLIKNLINN